MQCSGCRFWKDGGEGQGFCHRYPPSERGEFFGKHPRTPDHDWCGEWEKR